MSNVYHLAVILIFLMVTARYLVVTARYLVFTGGYCSLLAVTARYRSLLLVPTFSMKGLRNHESNNKWLQVTTNDCEQLKVTISQKTRETLIDLEWLVTLQIRN